LEELLLTVRFGDVLNLDLGHGRAALSRLWPWAPVLGR
jgi:hypothetical protein